MGSDDNFLLLLRGFLILKKRILDTVGKARRSPVAEIAVFYRLIKQQIHNHLLASFALVKKNKTKKDPTNPPNPKRKTNFPKSKAPTPTDIIITIHISWGIQVKKVVYVTLKQIQRMG